MSTKIDINDIIDANSHNSAMALTAAWATCFKKYAMEDYEDLSDSPASSFNIFTHLTAQGAAKMMYEQAARISETNISTAILPKSLINQLSVDEMNGIFGTPASTTIAFCIGKDDIIQNAIMDDNDKVYRLVINKELVTTFESHPSFTLPYDVIINYKPVQMREIDEKTGETYTSMDDNIYAYYDMPDLSNDGMRNVYGINNQYISSREMRFENKVYIAFFLKVFQLKRKEISFYVSDPFTSDTTITFENLLCGIEVYRTKVNTHVETLMNGVTEGNNLTSNSYNFSYDYKRNSQNINLLFSKMNDSSALTVGDEIRVVVYTTEGEQGNLEFPYMIYNINKLSVIYNQDLTKANQNAMINIICLAFARDKSATGGKNSLTLEEIRTKIINKRYSRNILISNMEIIKKGEEKGLSINQIEHDLIAMYYRSIDKLKYKNMILSTGMNNFYFDFSDKEKMLKGYNYYLIEPTDVFKYDKSSHRFKYIKSSSNVSDNDLDSYLDYVNKYNNANDKYDVIEAAFPFYMRYENTENPKIQIYDMFINDIEYLKFTDYKEQFALDKLDISFLKVIRNPYKTENSLSYNDKSSTNKYYVQFIVYTGENTLNKMYLQSHNSNPDLNYVNSDTENKYNKQYITFELSMIGVNDTDRYVINPTNLKILNVDTMINDGYIAYQASFETNNYISDDKQMQIKGIHNASSVSKDYTVFIPVDTTVHFKITGKFNDSVNNPNNTDCITYESDSVELVEYLSDDFKIDFDIGVKEPTYVKYENDVPYLYTRDIKIRNLTYNPNLYLPDNPTLNSDNPDFYEYKVETDNNGKVIFKLENSSIPTPIYKIAHKKDEVVYEYTKISVDDILNSSDSLKEYFISTEEIDENGDVIYIKYKPIDDEYDKLLTYYVANAKILHHSGEEKFFDKTTGVEVDLPYDEASGSTQNTRRELTQEYIGICKNVPWINRLYMSGETMYEKIVDMYRDIVTRTREIKNDLFEGGKIFIGLSNTTGKSSKFKAHKLSTNTYEALNDVALNFEFRVKYLDNANIEYKNQQIVNSTMEYINNIGDNNISIDKLFSAIKSKVPDIEYINIIKINNYLNGEVQTILNDTSINNEVLTVSQKIVIDDSGDIDFEPNISISVVQSE